MKFKKGDLIIANGDTSGITGLSITKDKVYTVIDFKPNDKFPVIIKDDKGLENWFLEKRFDLYQDQPTRMSMEDQVKLAKSYIGKLVKFGSNTVTVFKS